MNPRSGQGSYCS
uniref:Uncharacterized protein n=1 Tax=Anguilla anguilla TaxID=7936 RepID=A0A0E9U183_ANGAN